MATLLTGSGPLVKELYKATKNYWRLRTNVDFHIIEHCNLKVLEVVGFNPDVHKEHRIYISSLLLLSKIDKSKVESIVAGKNEENIRRRKRVPLQDLQAEALAEMTAEHIISRVHVSVDFEKKEFSFTLNPNIGDDVTEGNCLDFVIAKPTTLLPMIIERQKNSNSAEIAETLAALKADAAMLTAACSKADRFARLVSISSDGFKELLATSKAVRSKLDLSNMSLPRQRWIKAIRKVILQNTVAKVHKLLHKFNAGSKSIKHALTLALAVAEERGQAGVNLRSPRLAPLGSVSTTTITAQLSAPVKSNAVELPKITLSSNKRRSTADSHPVSGNSASSKLSAGGSTLGAIKGLIDSAVNAVIPVKKDEGFTANAAESGKKSKSARRRSTLETKAPDNKSARSAHASLPSLKPKGSVRFSENVVEAVSGQNDIDKEVTGDREGEGEGERLGAVEGERLGAVEGEGGAGGEVHPPRLGEDEEVVEDGNEEIDNGGTNVAVADG